MQKKKLFDILISVKPNTFMSSAFVIIIIIGILGEIFSWPIVFYGSGKIARLIIGFAIFILGWTLHLYCHKFHKQAHQMADQVQAIITSGPFSTIRHPMYLGLILMYFGLAIGWGIIWMLIPAVFFSALVIITAIKEEEFLFNKSSLQYQEYIKKVPWRFIPKVF